jgi:hypothetical protein
MKTLIHELIYEEALPLAAIEAPIQRLKDGEEKM